MAIGSKNGKNPALIRGDVQAGKTGDKRPGFDPALAPLETDAEAGGASFGSEDVDMARRHNADDAGGPDEDTTYATAMRHAGDASYGRYAGWPRPLLWVLGGAMLIAAILIVFLWR